MAAPTFVQAGTGTVNTGTTGLSTSLSGAVAGNVVILHIVADSGLATSLTVTGGSNVEDLSGTDGSMSVLATNQSCGTGPDAKQHTYIGRVVADGTVSILVVPPAGGADCYYRMYEFSGVNTGTALSDVIENSSAGATANGAGTSSTIADTGVTTLGADRLAVNLIGVNDDNQADFDTEAFTGMTGGTWVSGGSYGNSTGTDGAIGLQYATIASAGTINGGTLTMSASDAWGVIGFALIGTTSATKSPPFAQGFNSNMLR